MKKFFLFAACILAVTGIFSGCAKSVNYDDYVSERRTNIYLYSDDEAQIKIYCSEKEQPFSADGYRGQKSPLVEIYVTLPSNPEELEISAGKYSGEMNYLSVDNCFYLSFSAEDFNANNVEVTLTYSGKEKTYSVQSVKYDGLISSSEALECVREYDSELFEKLTDGTLFNGEIFVRLLYDDGCYYYVGVCDKDKKISAYLVDGERGRIIATKQLQG